MWRRALARPLRIAHAVTRDLAEGQLSLRAMSLVYSTLLSIVPLLAIGFSVLKGLGAEDRVAPLLRDALSAFGAHAEEISDRILGFVQNVKAGVLGSVGLVFLLYTASSLVQKIERALNMIWRIGRSRSLARRFSDYLSVLLVGPLLLTTALGMTASLTNEAFMARYIDPAVIPLLAVVGRVMPWFLIAAGFMFVYAFIPNTEVRLRSAFAGAVVATVLWKGLELAFAVFVAQATSVTAIYSAFAALVLFMIWLQLAWMVLLVGASVAYYHQNPDIALLGRGGLRPSPRLAEALALHVAAAIAHDFHRGEAPTDAGALSQRLRMPAELIETALEALTRAGIVIQAPAEHVSFVPARPTESIPVTAVLDAVRSDGEQPQVSPRRLPESGAVDRLLARRDAAVGEALAGATLRDLAVQASEAGPVAEAPDLPRGSRRA